MRRLLLTLLLVGIACEASSAEVPRGGKTVSLQVAAGPFPPVGENPNVIIYVPEGWDPKPPVSIVVFLHGHKNCAANVLGSKDRPCVPGRAPRTSHALAAQLGASRRNALLVVPQLPFDDVDSSAGRLDDEGGMRALLDETLPSVAPGLSTASVGQVVVISHSGGYHAAAGIALRGQVPVTEVHLLDSLYGDEERFESWIRAHAEELAAGRMRFTSTFTTFGETLEANRALADRLEGILPASAFFHTTVEHDEVPRLFVRRILQGGTLPQAGSALGERREDLPVQHAGRKCAGHLEPELAVAAVEQERGQVHGAAERRLDVVGAEGDRVGQLVAIAEDAHRGCVGLVPGDPDEPEPRVPVCPVDAVDVRLAGRARLAPRRPERHQRHVARKRLRANKLTVDRLRAKRRETVAPLTRKQRRRARAIAAAGQK
jgi:hypothetical protein